MSQLRSVTIGLPSMGSIKTLTVASLLDNLIHLKVPFAFSYPMHSLVQVARRDCVLEAQQAGSSHLCFIDSDMMFPGDLITRLAERNKPVIGVNAHEKRLPLVSTVKIGVDKPENWKAEDMPKAPFKCFAVGTGLMLIDMRVFEKMEQPWFAFSHHPDGSLDYGEDVWFCKRVREAGFEVWCDPTIPVGHIGDFAY